MNFLIKKQKQKKCNNEFERQKAENLASHSQAYRYGRQTEFGALQVDGFEFFGKHEAS